MGLKALERLLQGLVGENNPYRQYLNGVPVIMEDYELVKKDLEVLDIIKKYWEFEINNSQVFISYKRTSPMGLLPIEETKILKEWLENE